MLSSEYKVDAAKVAHTRDALSAVKFPMLVAALLLFVLPGGRVSAELLSGCTAYAFSPSTVHLDIPSSSFVTGTRAFYSDSGCTVATGDTISAGSGWVYADAEDEAESVCQEKVSSTSTATRLWDLYPEYATGNQKLWKCSGSSSSKGSGANGKKGKYLAKKVYIPPTGVTLNQTDLKLTAVDGLNSGIEFQRVDAAGVGIPSVIELGFLDAVDVWSNIGKGYEVCFPQIGRIVFLDAASSPRMVSMDVDYEHRDGYTCAALDKAGTLVLVKSDDSADVPPALEQPLTNCEITTTHRLNLRDAADGAVVQLVIPANHRLTPSARTQSWFRVVYADTGGWVSARFVNTQGDCAYRPLT